jgi:hypothetical protein
MRLPKPSKLLVVTTQEASGPESCAVSAVTVQAGMKLGCNTQVLPNLEAGLAGVSTLVALAACRSCPLMPARAACS